jgi:hypothetical protein
VHDLTDGQRQLRLGLSGHSRKVGRLEIESAAHAHGFENPDQARLERRVVARQRKLDMSWRGPQRGKQRLHLFIVKPLRDCGVAGVGQHDHHAHASALIGQTNGLVSLPFRQGEVGAQVHRGHLGFAVGEVKCLVPRGVGVKRGLPSRLEVDRVEEDEHRHRVELVEDRADLSVGLLLDPPVYRCEVVAP